MEQTENLVSWPLRKSVASVESFIHRLSQNFSFIRYPNGTKAILGELTKCYAAMPKRFPRISTNSMELLVRMTICTLQTQAALDDNLRQIICTGANCLNDKELAKELLEVTDPLAENSEWIQILQQQDLKILHPNGDDVTWQNILGHLKNAVKLTNLAVVVSPAFQNVALNVPFLWDKMLDTPFVNPDMIPDTACPQQKSMKLHTLSSTSKKMVGKVATVSKRLICDFCKKSFAIKKTLFVHMRIHIGDHPYKCGECGKTFVKLGNLTVHFRTHSGEKPFSCKFCQKSFSHKCALQDHERIHTAKRPHKCSTCSKTFATSGELVVHTRMHNGEKPYVCSVCQKGFAQSSNLSKHLRMHNGEKPYSCDICKKTFAHSGNLNTHKRIHNKEKP